MKRVEVLPPPKRRTAPPHRPKVIPARGSWIIEQSGGGGGGTGGGGPSDEPFNVTAVTASEVGPKYQDEKQGLHTVVGIVPVIDIDYSHSRTVTIWLDFGDGTIVWQGWYALTRAGQVVRIGDSVLGTDGVRKSGSIWVPANTAQGTWKVWCAAGKLDNGIDPTSFAHNTFTVVPVGACSPTGTTNAMFVNSPDTGNQIIYSLYDPGVWYWEYYELTWQPPTLAQEPNYWFTLITVQKGHWDGTTWTPAPDPEGRNEDPTGQYLGRVHDEVVLAPGVDPNQIAIMRKFGNNPATWKIPPAQNPDLSPNLYRDFRFLIYNVSRLGTDASGSGGAGTYTLETACWPGSTSFYILTPQPQTSALDIRAANPATIALPLTGGNGQPLTVSAGGITGPYIGNSAVQAINMAKDSITAANQALAANSVVDANVHDVSIAKFTAGTNIFTGDVILSRGPGNPVIVIKNTGLTLFGQADASTGATGLLTQPYVQIQSVGMKLLTGKGQSIQLDAANNALNFWYADGDITKPYVSITNAGIAMVDGALSFAVNSAAMQFLDTVNQNRLDLNSAGIALTHGLKADNTPAANANQVIIKPDAVQLIFSGVPGITMNSSGVVVSNGGAASVTITPSSVTIVNGSMTAPVISGGSLSIATSQGTVSISNTTNGVQVAAAGGNPTAHVASNVISIYDGSIGSEMAPTSLIVGKNSSTFCGFNTNAGTGNEGLVVGGRQVCKLDSNNWLGGLQYATAQVFGQEFGIYGVAVGWPQTATNNTGPGGSGPGLAAGQYSTFATGDGRTVYVQGGIIVNVK